jgi:[methyl-Co(III) methanol-specific corrinoid protein]:coenzyme M methyltransferase
MIPREIFLNALAGKSIPRPATGSATSMITTDLMDRAGACFPHANKDPEIMAKLALAGHTIVGFDNVTPLFSVWHESAALGCRVNWGDKGRMPDCNHKPYKIGDEITIPDDLLTRPEINVPLKAISILKKELNDGAAVTGKIFGPWTLGYHLFGVEEFLMNVLLQPDYIKKAMEILKAVTLSFGKAQIEAGADTLCIADHATRDLCPPEFYRDFLMDMHKEINSELDCPLMLHICGDTADRIPHINETGIACFHFDSKAGAERAVELAGEDLVLMGGTDNINIILNGTEDQIRADVRHKKELGITIIGPECAVPLDAPYKNLRILVDEVKKT